MTQLTHIPQNGRSPDASGGADGRTSAGARYLFGVAGAALFSALAAMSVLWLLERPTAPLPHQNKLPAGVALPGTLSLEAPPGTAASELRVTLLQSGSPARSASGEPLERVTAGGLARQSIKPGLYLARIIYRGQPVVDLTVRASSGVEGVIPLPGPKLARAEYEAGIRADARRSGDGIPYFKRTAQLDARHVESRLQLAAFELLGGAPAQVRAHLAAVRKLDPDNAEAAAIEKLLRERER